VRILTIDIETSPAIAYVWGLNKVYINRDHVIEPTRVLCFAAKWNDRAGIIFRSEFDDGRDTMLADLWALLDEADAVVHYNGKSFDVPHIQREFLLAGLLPPSPYAQIDLWRVVRSQFRFLSNRLDSVTKELDLGGKAAHEGMALWTACLAGDKGAWRRMERYNRQDVRLTSDLYEHLRPWIKGHPSFNLVTGAARSCPTCGSADVEKRGFHRTKVSAFQRFRCRDCGSYSHDGKRLSAVDLRAV
jgi:hypothetical protein